MEFHSLGKTGITVSRYCLGAMMLGSMGKTSRATGIDIVQRAFDAGINFINTADVYSAGESEEIIGAAIAGSRDQYVIATKCGLRPGEDPSRGDGSRQWITRAAEMSLERLGTDYIDLYQLHRADERTPLEETLAAFDALIRAGKIRAYGMSTSAPDHIVECHWTAERHGLIAPACEQPRYSLFARQSEAFVFPACRRYEMGVITYSPLDDGWLSGRYSSLEDLENTGRAVRMMARSLGPDYRKHPHVQRRLALVGELSALANQVGLPLAHLAMGFVLEHPAVTAAIIGPRTLDQLSHYIAGGDVRLSDDVLDRIDRIVAPGTDAPAVVAMPPSPSLTPSVRRRPRHSSLSNGAAGARPA